TRICFSCTGNKAITTTFPRTRTPCPCPEIVCSTKPMQERSERLVRRSKPLWPNTDLVQARWSRRKGHSRGKNRAGTSDTNHAAFHRDELGPCTPPAQATYRS